MGMQSTGDKVPRESPELTTAQHKMRWDHQPPFVIYSLCLATGLEAISEPGETRLCKIPGNPLNTSVPLLHKHLPVRPISRTVLVKPFQSRSGLAALPAVMRLLPPLPLQTLPEVYLTPRYLLTNCSNGKCSNTLLSHCDTSSGSHQHKPGKATGYLLIPSRLEFQ